MYQILCLVYSI